MAAYYNEIDPKAAAWLRELITEGLIADGEVDERSITDVSADDVRGFVQCHWFAGIGGWSYALRLAGWDDSRPVWTGSCPCQPWSVAGKGEGADDPRHLWPAWKRLIEECRPAAIFGEQTAGQDGLFWLDLVYADLEALDYAVGAVNLPAASVGAPHIRQRLWFVASCERRDRERLHLPTGEEPRKDRAEVGRGGEVGISAGGCLVADASHGGLGIDGRASGDAGHVDERDEARELGNASGARSGRHAGADAQTQRVVTRERTRVRGIDNQPQPTGAVGFWAACDWLPCRDGKSRPVESGTFPLASGVPARVVRLRGYGNAIVPQVAAEVIRACMEMA